MKINSNFKDLLRHLNDGGVRYPIVGGYVVMKYTEPYSTKDLDIWIEPTEENAARALEALRLFGAPATAVTAAGRAKDRLQARQLQKAKTLRPKGR